MGELPVVRVDSREAQRLADLGAIFQDLTFTIDASKRLLKVFDEHVDDSVMIQALWTAALISYVRCFAQGRRFGLSENILSQLEGEPVEVHRFYKNLRDKHVAHSVNPFEEMAVGAVLREPDSGSTEVQGVTTLTMKLIAADQQGVENLIALAAALRKHVKNMAKEAEATVLEQVKKIPVDELRRNPPLRVYVPGPERAGTPRSNK